MPEEKTFYVGVGNKSEVRRELLECSKSVVGILKNYEKVNELREEKVEKIVELKNVLAEIKQLSFILKDKFPSEKVGTKRVVVREKRQPLKKIVVKKAHNKPNNEIKKLEEELSEIEERLNKMGA